VSAILDLVCDACPAIATRLILQGDPKDRRFLCATCAENPDAALGEGKRENDAVRMLPLAKITEVMREQNVRRGLLAPQRHRAPQRRERGDR
jgi:hypothetical protein